MESKGTEVLRYKVALKKGYRIGFLFLGVFLVTVSAPIAFLSFSMSEKAGEYIFSIAVALFFASMGILQLFQLRKELAVYKGRLEYCNGFYCKTYSLSEVYEYDTRLEETSAEYGDGTATPGSWDEVSTFYDGNGKKLFRFGLAYNNVERFKKDVDNCRKSIRNNKKKR